MKHPLAALGRILAGDHHRRIGTERAIAREEPEPMTAADVDRWLDA